ncbi:MAG: fused MFS/spermidine synthase [Thermoanaerobaculia bacterium]
MNSTDGTSLSPDTAAHARHTAFPRIHFVALALCVASVFSSAFLLFVLEPLITRMHLTRYGGSAAVWNTALVFFQAALLLGYMYAERLPAWLGERRHLVVHAILLAVPLLFLPPALRWSADGASPVTAILFSLGVNIGMPFFVLASNTTLVQVWYARSSGSRDPYWLYAASNLGSVLALVLYPFVIEPALGIRAQAELWRFGYVAFLGVSVAILILAYGGRGSVPLQSTPVKKSALSTRAGWVLRAAIGSSLLMSVTMALTSNLGSTPLLWTIPLLIYLVTFVIAFGNASPRRRLIEWGAIAGVAVSMASLFYALPLRVIVPGYLLALFFGALICHRDVVQRRPDPGELPSFYLAIALGGFIGGILNAIVAPLLFDRLSEFPITLALLAVLIDADRPWRENFPRERLRQPGVLLPPATMLVMIVITYVAAASSHPIASALRASLLLALVMFGVLLGRHRGQFTAAVLLVALFLLTGRTWGAETIREERSFFGVSAVVREGNVTLYRHSGVVHGAQLDPPNDALSTTYYHPASPTGSMFARVPAGGRIGAIGLGVGSVAVLTGEGQRIDFFEIDPMVERIAREEFSFLAHARSSVTVEIGDGRLLVAQKPDRHYDLLYVDAFSGGSIPLHLFTSEALELYLRKCTTDGVVVFHISSRAIAFDRVLRGWSRATGVPVLYRGFRPTAPQIAEGAKPSDIVAISASPATREALTRDGWITLRLQGRGVLWTDDHASAMSVMNLAH